MERIKNHKTLIFVVCAILCFIVTGCLFMFTDVGSVKVDGAEQDTLDGAFRYAPSKVYETLDNYGADGRRQYTVVHILDYFFLASYCALMMAVTKPLTDKKTYPLWIIMPLLPAVFDVMENTSIEIAIARFPDISNGLATAISVFTTAKWSFGVAWFVTFAVLAIIRIVRRLKEIDKNTERT